MAKNFYRYQRNRTQILIFWGAANTLIGMVGAVGSKNKFWRQFWLQAFAWGAIDAIIGLVGNRSQTRRLEAEATNTATRANADEEPLSSAVVKDIRNFYRVLLINVFLDVGYVLSGEFIRRWAVKNKRPDRRGIGVGFQFQGLYLFLYDFTLAVEVKQRWISKQ